MKKYLFPILLLISLTFNVFSQEKKAIFILIDGVPADVLEQVNTPILDEVAEAGGYTRAYVGGGKGTYSETPTISAPGYMNMVTGVWANKHNVWGNGVKAPNYNYWNAFRILRHVAPEKKIAIFSTWLDNRTKLIGEGLPNAGNIMFDYAFDGFEFDTITFPHKPDRKYILDIDELVSKETARYIKAKAPDLSWVYLEFTDDMGHKFGDSPEMVDAVRKADNQIGRIWKAIKERESRYDEDWVIVVTTDHGRTLKDGKGHGGQSERERTTWIVTNHTDLNTRFQDNPAIVDVMPSILAHMEVGLPNELKSEIDGVSFVKAISVSEAHASLENNQLKVTWKAAPKNAAIEVHMAHTNYFAKGGKDNYELIGTADLSKGVFEKRLSLEKGTYKILLKTADNWVNTWLVIE